MPRFLWITAPSIAVLSVAAVAVSASPAGAHAEIRQSDPPAGGVAPVGTDELTMTFIALDPSEPIEISVLDPDGDELVTGDADVEETTALGTTVSVPVQPLEEGLHLVSWRAMSSDGDGITADTFEFTVEGSSEGGDLGIWLVWAAALLIPAAILLRPGRRRSRDQDQPRDG